MRDRRHASHAAGLSAEALAALALRLKGYRILARRWRSPLGEIDLIARAPGRDPVIAAIEVKHRASLEAAAGAALARQRARIARAAAHYLSLNPQLAGASLRFDVVLCAPWRWPRHLRDAWQADGRGVSR